MIGRALALFLFGCALAAPARAHDTFLWPAAFEIPPAREVALSLSSTAEFPSLETGPAPERIAAMSEGMAVSGPQPNALGLAIANPRRGLNVAALALGPRDIELQPDDAAHYFEEIGVSAETRTAYEALAEPRVLNETYTKYAKAIFCVGRCADQIRASAHAGHALEFVAFGDRSGVTLRRFVLYAHARPASEQQVAVTTADGRRRVLRTNASGIVDLPDDVRGPTLLSATILRPPAEPGGRFTSDFATLTFNAP